MTWQPDYVSAEEMKNELHMPEDDTADDAQIARWVTSASRSVDDWCHRQFGQLDAPATWTYDDPLWDRRDGAWYVDIDDVQDPTGLVVAWEGGDPLDASAWRLLDRNAPDKGQAYTRLRIASSSGSQGFTTWNGCRSIEVTALFGWLTVPAAVKQATFLQGQRLEARRSSPFGVAGSPSEGSEIRLQEKLDVDARVAVKGYQRTWWAR